MEEFVQRSQTPALFFAASRGAAPDRELDEFVRLAEASAPFSTAFDAVTPRDWAAALRLVAEAATEPCIVVIDELPWLTASTAHLEGALQTAWDRYLSKAPVMLVVLGSDLSMMDVEVDLIGSPAAEFPAEVAFVGSVKWREQAPFDRGDVLRLAEHRSRVPGAEGVPLVAVARTQVTGDADVALVAADLLAAWT